MTGKERLEEIKNSYLVGIHRLFGTSWVLIPKENSDWLINRIEELEKEIKQIEKVSDYNADLRMRYKQALQEIDNEAETAIHYGFTSLKDFCYRLRKQIEKAMEGEK